MVGILLDGREHGRGAHAFAEDVARHLACENQPAHLFFLVPTPVQTPRVIHSTVAVGPAAARLEPHALLDPAAGGEGAATADLTSLPPRELHTCFERMADALLAQIARHGIETLHAIGLDLPAAVGRLVKEQTGLPLFVTPRGRDLVRDDPRFDSRARAALVEAQAVVCFDPETQRALETRFAPRPGQHMHCRTVERGVDLERFAPLPRRERHAEVEDRLRRPEVRARLEGVDWDQGYVVFAMEPRDDRHGFEQFLFAVPELLNLQPRLQVIVFGSSEQHTDGLRAAMAAGRPELLHDVVQSSELCQPLMDHLERLHQEGRTGSWWQTAARLEPERRVRFLGDLRRDEFATLLRAADLFVVPGARVRTPSQTFYEAVACGVLPLASELSGISGLSQVIGEEISVEIASFCVLRAGVQPVREMEDKIGRILRLRPAIADRLRALALKRFDAGRMAAALRRIHKHRDRVAAGRPTLDIGSGR